MSAGPPRDVRRPLLGAALARGGDGMTDGQLLDGFVARRDEAAFAALVRRHGPMVLGVCRRVLRHAQDAEDAFQATFLVLARKAVAIGRRELLGNWLYGVAYRTALDARAAAARRRTRERQVDPMPEPPAPDSAADWRDLGPLLDLELNRLPDKYRAPVVLCDLEGRTRRDVARQLGLPAGTLSGRLTTARGMLARRLARHGLALSAAALAAALSPGAASAGIPPALVASTVEAAATVVKGRVVASAVSAKVAALAQGVLNAMLLTGRKMGAAVVLAAIAVTIAALAYRDADDTGAKVLRLDARGRRVAWSPDGKTLAVVTKVEKTILGYKYDGKGCAVQLWDVATRQLRHTLAESALGGLAFQQVVYSADGTAIAATVTEEVVLPGSRQVRDVVKIWDAKTLALKQTLGGDPQLVCVALSPDGRRVAAGSPGGKAVRLWNAATGAPERTLPTGDAQPWSVVFSPDSKVLIVGGQKRDGSGVVTLWDTETGNLKRTLKPAKSVAAVAVSGDGTMIASSGGGGVVQLWSMESGDKIVSLNGDPHGHRTIAFSPDGRTVAAGGPDGKVRLWDVPSGALTATLEGHTAEVYAVAFSPDGQTLASTSQDQTVRLWPITKSDAGAK